MNTDIPPLVHLVTDDEVKGKARELFKQIEKKAGKVPKWMRVMANCDDILVGFFTLFKAIMDDAPVDKRLKWIIALKVSRLNECRFCVSIAEQQLKSFDLTDEEIKNIDHHHLSNKEKIAIKYAIASTEHAYNIDPKIMKEMKKYWTDAQIVEISSVVGLFNFINRFNDSLGILPDVEDL